MKTEEQRKVDFLLGLAKLTRETGVFITGCGCCGSPDLVTLGPFVEDKGAGYGYGYAGEVTWISPNDKYDWDKYKDTIPKEDGQ